MFNFNHVKGIVASGGIVEYKGLSICDLTKVVNYPFSTDRPYQVNCSFARMDETHSNLNVAVNRFLDRCKEKKLQ